MSEATFLLDSPARSSLQSQSAILRAALKDFERSFAANNEGRKPSKSDIKADVTIAAQYKQYNKVRDVLSGKLNYEAYLAPPQSPVAKKSHRQIDSAVSWTPSKPRYDTTPRKNTKSFSVDQYDAPSSATPKPVLFSVIGPTPQRDGVVMGLFDMLTNSAKSSQATPSTNRKRKLDEVHESTDQSTALARTAQTPKQKRKNSAGDLLQHLIGTPETGRRRHSRTPASDGKRFMLSQFFATPSTVRFSQFEADGEAKVDGNLTTPLRDRVLGLSPQGDRPSHTASDATPAYLVRSTSFKDRLMSAADIGAGPRRSASFMSLAGLRHGPPTLQQFKTAPKPLSQIVANLRSLEDGEHDDDLEALHELENSEFDTLVGDSQVDILRHRDEAKSDENAGQATRIWKKRGQKRTTRRSKMRPTVGPIADAPRFVAADEESEGDSDGNSREEREEQAEVAETQLTYAEDRTGDVSGHSDSERPSDHEGQLTDSGFESDSKPRRKSKAQTMDKKNASGSGSGSRSRSDGKQKTATGRKPGTYNPNAQSHMNFRSLKIRNKNSRARGAGRSRFTKRR